MKRLGIGSLRVCSKRGCRTRLSRYNPDERCWVHAHPQPYRHRVTKAGR